MNRPVVLFDGVCYFCNAVVNRLIRHDKKRILRFAALQSAAGQRLLKQYNLPQQDFDSFILIDGDRVYKRSAAALALYNQLGWQWKWTQIFRLVPGVFRDYVYDVFARNRYRWFGQKEECMIPTPEVRDRFLD